MPPAPVRPTRRLVAACASAEAGVIHLAVGLGEATVHDLAMTLGLVGMGAAQVLLALGLAGARPPVRLAVATNLVALVALMLTSTVGLPILHPHPEPLSTARIVTLLLQAVVVWALRPPSREGRTSPHREALASGTPVPGSPATLD